MGVRSYVPCDADKLNDSFKRRGLTAQQVAQELGYEKQYFAKVKSRHKITCSVAKMLEIEYRITEDEYKPLQIEKEELKEELTAVKNSLARTEEVSAIVEAFNVVNNDLYALVYTAVYEAVKKAWAE